MDQNFFPDRGCYGNQGLRKLRVAMATVAGEKFWSAQIMRLVILCRPTKNQIKRIITFRDKLSQPPKFTRLLGGIRPSNRVKNLQKIEKYHFFAISHHITKNYVAYVVLSLILVNMS